MQILIKNCKYYKGNGEYVGRPSILGNPFKIGVDGNREEVIRKFKNYLWKQINLERSAVQNEIFRLAEISKKQDLILICWCKEPNREVACHADIIKACIEYVKKKYSMG